MLTTVRAVNKTDSATMGADFSTLAAMFRAPEEALSTVPGLGPTKVKRLHNAFSTPFFRTGTVEAHRSASRSASRELPLRRNSDAARSGEVARDGAAAHPAPQAARAASAQHGGWPAMSGGVEAGVATDVENGEGGDGAARQGHSQGRKSRLTEEEREWIATQQVAIEGDDLPDDDSDFA